MKALREARMKYNRDVIDGFRMRGRDVTRLESFSDAVFGFALTLLVVSLEVPKSFADLIAAMKDFPAFAVCFAMLAMLWNSHYRFCRRYGLDDGTTRFFTCVLLFIVLLYVYPLKFLFNLSVNDMIFGPFRCCSDNPGGRSADVAFRLRLWICWRLSSVNFALPACLAVT